MHAPTKFVPLFALLFSVLILESVVGQVPTPLMSHSVDFGKDKTAWKMDFFDGNQNKFLAEWVPKGQSIQAWDEMLAFQVDFTDASLTKFVENWKQTIKQAATDVEMEEAAKESNSITISYTSKKFRETGIRRFVKATDGVYVFAYHARPETVKEERLQLWSKIIAKAKLVPNPELAK